MLYFNLFILLISEFNMSFYLEKIKKKLNLKFNLKAILKYGSVSKCD